jgi:O-antigen/teichoic acid export membrane protein
LTPHELKNRFFSEINSFSKSIFLKNFSYVFVGNGLALGIGLVFTPIFSRIYTPSAYGLFAIYMSLTVTVSQFITLQYPRAFVIPKDDKKFYDLVRVSMMAVFIFGLFFFLILAVAKSSILRLFHAEILGNWIYLIPVSIVLGGMNDIWRSWNIRVKEFKRGASAKIFSTLFTRFFTLGYGLITSGGSIGLILGDFISKPSDSFLVQTKRIRSSLSELWRGTSLKRVWETAKEYHQYPLFLLPGNWLYNLVLQLPPLFLGIYFSKDQIGYYSMTNSLFLLPMSVLTTALGPVFLQKASETFHNEPGEIKRIVKKLYWTLHLSGLVPFAVLIVFGDVIMRLFLGKQWLGAGFFASVLGYYFIFSISSYVLNALYRIYKKEKVFLIINLVTVILCIAGLWAGAVVYKDIKFSITAFCIANAAGQILHIWYTLRLAKLPALKYIFLSIFLGALVVGFFYLVRILIMRNG